jgi:hypothetical protein
MKHKRYDKIIDEVYQYYLNTHKDELFILDEEMDLSKDKFIEKVTNNYGFGQLFGISLNERLLSFEERWDLSEKYGYRKKGGEIPSETETFNGVNEREEFNSMMNDPVMGANLPTKLITITYNDKTIESYE